MAGKYIIGADIGTQSIKVHLYNEKLQLIARAATEQYVETLKPMWMTQKSSVWWEIVKTNIKKVMREAGVTGEEVAVFGCCAHMHGAVPVKMDGTVLEDDIQLYSDKRGGYLAEQMAENLSEAAYEASANAPIASWHGIKIKWLKEHKKELYEQADKFLTPKDFINFKLTGQACIDPSEASGVFAMDRHTQQWSDLLLQELGIEKEKLPDIHKAYEVIGTVSKKAAQETGLGENTAVIAGGGDMLCMLYISGMHKMGTVADLTGTGGVICGYTKQPVMDKRIMNLRHVLDGWVPFGNIDGAGISFRWLRDNLCKKEAEYARKRGIDDYAYLCQLAQKVPAGSEGLYFQPYLMGERTMGSADSRACFVGLSLEKQAGHLVRALLEGVAFEFKRTIDVFETNGNPVESVFHTGGGAKGDLWNQIKADIYQKPIYTLEEDEGGVLGASLLAAYAVGFVDDLAKGAESLLKIKKVYEPNSKNKAVYEDMYGVFCELHDVMQSPFKSMAKVWEKHNK